jgi:hypothetical protein
VPNLRPQELIIMFVIMVFLLVVVAFVVWLAVVMASRFGGSSDVQVSAPPGSSGAHGRFCHQCGSLLKPDARFCSDCGEAQ